MDGEEKFTISECRCGRKILCSGKDACIDKYISFIYKKIDDKDFFFINFNG